MHSVIGLVCLICSRTLAAATLMKYTYIRWQWGNCETIHIIYLKILYI